MNLASFRAGKMQPTRYLLPFNRWISKHDDESNRESEIDELGQVDQNAFILIATSGLVRSNVAGCLRWSQIGRQEVAVNEVFLERSVERIVYRMWIYGKLRTVSSVSTD
jgi:hypothetical protein